MRAILGPSVRGLCVLASLLFVLSPNAHAQTDPAVAALEEKIKELEQRLEDVEDKFVDVERDDVKLRAPFSVVNEQGQPIFQVISTGGQSTFVFIGGDAAGTGGSKILLEAGTGASPGGRISLMGASGGNVPVFQAGEVGGKAVAIVGDKAGPHVLLQADGSLVEMTATQGEGREVSTKVDGENVMIRTESNGNATVLGDQGGTLGMVLELGGKPAAELSKWPDRQFGSVRIYGDGGNIVAGLGADINNPASGIMTVFSNGDANGVIAKGDGTIEVKRDGTAKIKLDALKQTISLEGTVPEAIVISAEKQTISVKGSGSQKMVIDGSKGFAVQSGDNVLAVLGLKPGGSDAGRLMVFRGGTPVFTATSEGSGGLVKVGDESTPFVEISTDSGQAMITVDGTGDNNVALIASKGTSTVRAESDGNITTSIGDYQDAVGVFVESGNALLGELSKRKDRQGASLRIWSGDDMVAGMGGMFDDPSTGIVTARGPSGEGTMTGVGWIGLKQDDALKVVASAPDQVIALYGQGDGYIVTLSPGSSGGGNITTYDTGGTGVFSAGAATDGGGEACVIRQNGGYCLGVGLPLMGGGN